MYEPTQEELKLFSTALFTYIIRAYGMSRAEYKENYDALIRLKEAGHANPRQDYDALWLLSDFEDEEDDDGVITC